MKDKKIIFFGTPQFSVPFLEALLKEKYTISAVVTAEDKKVGRKKELLPSPVKKCAEENNIPVLTPKKIRNNKAFLDEIKTIAPELGIVIAYGKIIPQELIDIPRKGIINIHPSRLPEYRGPSPMQYALLNGDSETAIDIMQIDAGMDTGDILFEKEVSISENESYSELQERIAHIGSQFLVEKLPFILRGEVSPKKQNESQATYSKIIKRTDGQIYPETDSVEKIVNKSRAFTPWPGIYLMHNNKRIKLFGINGVCTDEALRNMGDFFITDSGECAIMCANGYIVPQHLQIEGKKKSANRDFVKGYTHLFV